MRSLPTLDSQRIEQNADGVVFIKPDRGTSLLLAMVLGLATLFILQLASRKIFIELDFLSGVKALTLALVPGILAFALFNLGKKPPMKFYRTARTFKIGEKDAETVIPFDEIEGFYVDTQGATTVRSMKTSSIGVALKNGGKIEIGIITNTDEKKIREKVDCLIKFLTEATGINLTNGAHGENG